MEIYAPLAGRMGMQGMREELEELAFRYINPEAYRTVTARLADMFERNRGVIGEIEKSLSELFDKQQSEGGGEEPPEEALVGVPQDGGQGAVLRAAFRHFRLPRRRRYGRGLLPGAGRHPHDMVDGSGPLQGLHLDAEAERLPLDPHHHRRPVAPAHRIADTHPRDEQDRRIWRRRACALQGHRRQGERVDAHHLQGNQCLCLAAAHHRAAGRRRQSRGFPRKHQARAVPGPGLLLHARRAC